MILRQIPLPLTSLSSSLYKHSLRCGSSSTPVTIPIPTTNPQTVIPLKDSTVQLKPEVAKLTDWEFNSPLQLYDYRASHGLIRDDPNQRKIITSLCQLHDKLRTYVPPKITIATSPEKKHTGLFTKFAGMLGKYISIHKSSRKVPGSDSSIPDIKGIYLYGDVGCGKTMLMDLFYATIPPNLSKKRIHFHQFMQSVHKRSHQIKVEHHPSDIDPIPLLAAEIAQQSTILCFDEFQVTDVADAMLLRRLLMMLISEEFGLVLFATSNRAPDDLYLNGIQRALFIPCIKMIKEKCRVIYLKSPTDYRKIPKPLSHVYYFPKPGVRWDSKANVATLASHTAQWFSYFSKDALAAPEHLEPIVVHNFYLTVWGRKVLVPTCVPKRVAQFLFAQLCGDNKLAGDYLALANLFQSFVITDIPYLSINARDQVRRFITFLDAVYDAHGRLATTAAALFRDLFVEPEDLERGDYQLFRKNHDLGVEHNYDNDDLVTKHGFDKAVAKKAAMFANDEEKFAFARALSRLLQMSTTEWIEAPRSPRE